MRWVAIGDDSDHRSEDESTPVSDERPTAGATKRKHEVSPSGTPWFTC